MEVTDKTGLDLDDLKLSGSITYQAQGQLYQKDFTDLKVEKYEDKEVLPHTFRYESIDLLKKILATYMANKTQGGVDQCVNFTEEFYNKWKKFELEDDFYKGMI